METTSLSLHSCEGDKCLSPHDGYPLQKVSFEAYLLIGDGRLATHFSYYFESLNIPFYQWSRGHHSLEELSSLTQKSSHILFLIKDSAIAEFYQNHIGYWKNKACFHCSGSLYLPQVGGVHPLMSFSSQLYSIEEYKKIPLVMEERLQQIENPWPHLEHHKKYFINPILKTKYHALCSLAVGMSYLNWEAIEKSFDIDFQMPKEILFEYKKRVLKNVSEDPKGLTGPLVRGDGVTIERHLTALQGHILENLYKNHLDLFRFVHKVSD